MPRRTTPAPLSILDVLTDRRFLRPWFGETWDAWRVFAKALFGLDMATHEREAYTRFTGRTTPPTAPAREAWVIVGRRGGKSLMAAALAVYAAAFRDYRPFLKPGERAVVMVIAGDREQAGVVFKYIEAFFDQVALLAPLVVSRTKESLDLSNQVTVQVQTCNFRRLRGRTVAVCIADEISWWMSEENSANPDTEIIRALKPSMATIPSSLLVAISSPYAKRGALFEAHRAHYGKENDPTLVWQAPTQAMNPTLDAAVIQEAYATDPSAAKAEYGALFRDDIESFLSSAWVDAVTVPGRYEVGPQSGYYYVAATDASGGAGGDAFVAAVAHPEGRGSEKKIVLDVLKGWWPRGGDSDLESIVREIAALLRRFSLRVIHGDRYSSHWIIEAFRREGIRYEEPRVRSLNDPDTTTYLDKSGAYAEIEPLIATKHVELLDHPVMLREMKSLERRLRSGGKTVIDHAPGAHDDHANAAALAIALAASKAGLRPAFAAVNDGIRRIGEPRSDSGGLGAVTGGQIAHAAAGIVGGQAVHVLRRYNR